MTRWFELRLPPAPRSVGIARSSVVAAAQLAGLPADVTADARTCVSEAVTNAVHAHTRGSVDADVLVRFGADVASLVVEVHDQGAGLPAAPRPIEWEEPADTVVESEIPGLAEGGFGLPVMHALADRVDIETGEGRGTMIRLHFGAEITPEAVGSP